MSLDKTKKILFIGDISTRAGRSVIAKVLPGLKKKYGIGLVIANCENAAGGRGVTREIINELQSYGIDYFTTGEHVWDIAEFRKELEEENLPLLRPYNYEGGEEIPGKGWNIIDLGAEGKIALMSFIGQVFMRDHVRSPFWSFDELYHKIEEKVGNKELKNIPILIDFHAETTSEKIAFAWYIRNKVTAVLGTHTHVGTIDARLLERKNNKGFCAFVTDTGMCGPANASLWVSFDPVVHNFRFPYKKSFKAEKSKGRIFNSVLLEIEKNSAKKISRIDKFVD